MNNKKILIINNGLAGGGIERASVSMANYFVTLGYEINVVAVYKSEHFFTLDPRISFTEPTFSRETTNRNLYVLKMMAFVRKTVKEIRPYVILAFGEWTNSFVVMAISGLQIPCFLSDRMSPSLHLTPIHRYLKKIYYKKAKGIIAQTNYAKDVIKYRTGAKNIKVISNPVNCIERVDCVQKNRIVTVGRLSVEKGHRYLIEAFARVKDKTWELSIVGDGKERETLELLATNLGITDRVIFHGHQKDFSLQLSEAQIFVLPSLKEGFPNALIEAMSVPLACISSNCVAGPSDIIEDGVNGLLVETGNVDALADALNRLIENPDLRDNIAGEAYKIRETLAFDKIANKYLEFILEQNN
ncbi:MAG: glycosyltransferase [Paludibacter sp.]|nr:glycosyltransferase [Paludibacter sp.]